MSIELRPTLTYDGTVPWRDIGRGEQVLTDAIRDFGAIVRVTARERPYTEICSVKTLGRWSVYCEPGVRFSAEDRAVGRFIIDTPRPSDVASGILELYDYVQDAGNGISQTKGHLLVKGGRVSGIGVPRGGDTGIFASHAGGYRKFTVLDDVMVDYHGSHNTYLDGTVNLFLGGSYHSADPTRGDDRSNQYDSARTMADVVVMIGTKLYTTDPDPAATARGYSSMVLGLVSCQRGFFKDILVERTCPPRKGARFAIGIRARQSFGAADRYWVGDQPGPDDQMIPSLPGWAWFAPYTSDEHGEARRPYQPNPKFFAADYWQKVREAGIATDRDMFFNPHCFQHVFVNPTVINHGPGGVGFFGEGTQPVEPKYAHGQLHDPPKSREEDFDQDDYLPLPSGWVERNGIYVVNPTFETDSADFEPYVARDASKFIPRKTNAALVAVTGNGVANDTTVRIFAYKTAPSWMPARVNLDHVPGFNAVFPEYAAALAEAIWRP